MKSNKNLFIDFVGFFVVQMHQTTPHWLEDTLFFPSTTRSFAEHKYVRRYWKPDATKDWKFMSYYTACFVFMGPLRWRRMNRHKNTSYNQQSRHLLCLPGEGVNNGHNIVEHLVFARGELEYTGENRQQEHIHKYWLFGPHSGEHWNI